MELLADEEADEERMPDDRELEGTMVVKGKQNSPFLGEVLIRA
jgi:hypothetical protein